MDKPHDTAMEIKGGTGSTMILQIGSPKRAGDCSTALRPETREALNPFRFKQE